MLINFNDILFLSKKVKGIIHIGAHELEELSDYLKGNVSRVIWIEANPKKYNFINKELKYFENMVLGKFAVGSENGNKILNLANNGQSSSILELGTHLISYPEVNYNSKIEVEMKKLDDWLDQNFTNKNLYKGDKLSLQDFHFSRTSQTTNISQIELLKALGTNLVKDIKVNTVIDFKHLNAK